MQEDKIQAWFTSNKLPEFTREQRETYKRMLGEKYGSDSNQQLEINGIVINGRHINRCMTSLANFIAIISFLDGIGKAPIVCGVKNKDGSFDESVFPKNQAEYDKFFQPDIDGIIQPDNTSGEWLAFNEVV